MRILFVSLCFFFLKVALPAQNRTQRLQDSLLLQEKKHRLFCSPGIANKSRSRGLDIGYMARSGGQVRPDENPGAALPGELESLEGIILKIKAPLINSPDFKLLAGFNYEPEKYFFSAIPVPERTFASRMSLSDVFREIDTRYLKQTALNLYGLKALNDRHYLAFRARVSSNGDYNGLMNFDTRYLAYNATLGFGIKRHESLEYGFGLNFSSDFQRTLVLPFVIYNRNFNDKWGLEAVLPASVYGRYNLDPQTILMFGYEFNSQAYSVDIQNALTGGHSEYHLDHSEVMMGLNLEREIVPWVWFNVRAGYQFNFRTRFEAQSADAISFRMLPANAPYLRVGVFLSPPDKFVN